MKGFSDGGKWVDPLHQCRKCKGPMPLPESEGKHCPACGTREPTAADIAQERQGKTCPKCGATGLTGSFCAECGQKL